MVGSVPNFDPESAPLAPDFLGRGVPQLPVAAERLTPLALKQRFINLPFWQAELNADLISHTPSQLQAAAVLVPLVVYNHGVHVLFTERALHLQHHAGQVSFPGGRIETSDCDAVSAALRETFEEIGLEPKAVQIIGSLPDYHTVTRYRVTPVVGLIDALPALKLDPLEVAGAFEVPLEYLMNPCHYQLRRITLEGIPRTFYSIPFESGRRYFIWGATAAILRNFYHFLSA